MFPSMLHVSPRYEVDPISTYFIYIYILGLQHVCFMLAGLAGAYREFSPGRGEYQKWPYSQKKDWWAQMGVITPLLTYPLYTPVHAGSCFFHECPSSIISKLINSPSYLFEYFSRVADPDLDWPNPDPTHQNKSSRNILKCTYFNLNWSIKIYKKKRSKAKHPRKEGDLDQIFKKIRIRIIFF